LLQCYATNRDEDAFAELVQRHVNLVYSAALRKLNGDSFEARDVTQWVFVSLAKHAALLRDDVVLASWLYTAAQNRACNVVRSEQRRRHWEREAQTMHDMLQSPEPSVEWDRVRPVLEDAMHDLKEVDRIALLLRYFENRPFAEIGETLTVTENGARMRVERALHKLHAALARRGIDSTATALAAGLSAHSITAAPAGLAAATTASALAAATAASSTATFTLISIMSTMKVTVAAGVLALAAVGLSLRQTVSLRNARADVAASNAKMRDEQDRVQLLAAEVSELKQAPASPVTASTGGRNMVDVQAYEQAKAQRLADEARARAEAQEKVALSPELQQLRFSAFRASMALRYKPLHTSLRLSNDQSERFTKLMEQRFWAVSDVTASARAQKLSRTDPAFQAMRDAALVEVDAKMQALLGEAGYAQLTAFEATTPARDLVEKIQGKLAFSAAPLPMDQALQLAGIFERNRLAESANDVSWLETQIMGGGNVGRLELGDVHWDNALPHLRTLLSADQLSALNTLYLQQALQHRADRTYERRAREVAKR
jgi:RNA polymerase sigma factor (sigma-70 family)